MPIFRYKLVRIDKYTKEGTFGSESKENAEKALNKYLNENFDSSHMKIDGPSRTKTRIVILEEVNE